MVHYNVHWGIHAKCTNKVPKQMTCWFSETDGQRHINLHVVLLHCFRPKTAPLYAHNNPVAPSLSLIFLNMSKLRLSHMIFHERLSWALLKCLMDDTFRQRFGSTSSSKSMPQQVIKKGGMAHWPYYTYEHDHWQKVQRTAEIRALWEKSIYAPHPRKNTTGFSYVNAKKIQSSLKKNKLKEIVSGWYELERLLWNWKQNKKL